MYNYHNLNAKIGQGSLKSCDKQHENCLPYNAKILKIAEKIAENAIKVMTIDRNFCISGSLEKYWGCYKMKNPL